MAAPACLCGLIGAGVQGSLSGLKTIASQRCDPEDPQLASESQFGVTRALVGRCENRTDATCALEFTFVLEHGQTWMPKALIASKAGAA